MTQVITIMRSDDMAGELQRNSRADTYERGSIQHENHSTCHKGK